MKRLEVRCLYGDGYVTFRYDIYDEMWYRVELFNDFLLFKIRATNGEWSTVLGIKPEQVVYWNVDDRPEPIQNEEAEEWI